MSTHVIPDVHIHEYEGPKKPEMSSHAATHSPLLLSILASHSLSVHKTRETDFEFLADIISIPNIPVDRHDTC